MRSATILVNGREAGKLIELVPASQYRFVYHKEYAGRPVSLTMPLTKSSYDFIGFPPFFEGLLPEGFHMDGLLHESGIEPDDLFALLLAIGGDLKGHCTIMEEQQ